MSDGYELEELPRIEAALDALVSPTSADVFQATRPFDERAIAAVAAKRAGDGSGGSQPALYGVFEAALNANIPCADDAVTTITWDQLSQGVGTGLGLSDDKTEIVPSDAGIYTICVLVVYDHTSTTGHRGIAISANGAGIGSGADLILPADALAPNGFYHLSTQTLFYLDPAVTDNPYNTTMQAYAVITGAGQSVDISYASATVARIG